MYDFQPLPVSSIRLLKIQPELRDGDIACILNQYDHQIPPYDALSYFWGDPKPTRKIYVNNSLVAIHEALWEFLDQMQRSRQTENWIWTDFLCFDQKNHEEMGRQVPRMGHIYSEAMRTISWLGCNRSPWLSWAYGCRPEGPPDLEEDIRLIAEEVAAKRVLVESFYAQPNLVRRTHVTKFMRDMSDITGLALSESSRVAPGEALPKAIKEFVQLSQLQSTRNILVSPYWGRAWVVQEVALAKKVTLMFGGVSLDFDTFLLAYKSYFYVMQRGHCLGGAKRRVPIEARTALNDRNVSFQQIVGWVQDCRASRSLDRIYGLLGLMAHCGDGIDALPSTLTGTIDYTRDLRDIYWDIAFTRPCSINSSTVDENDDLERIERWVRGLSNLGNILNCPFTHEYLRQADNERATPLLRNKVRLALTFNDMCRQIAINDSSVWLEWRDSSSWDPTHSRPWLTKRCARRLWSEPTDLLIPKLGLERLVGSLLLETADSLEMHETDQYQAILIALRMQEEAWDSRGRGGWTCESDPSVWAGLWGHQVDINFDFIIQPRTMQQLSCATKNGPGKQSHRCRTLERYLVIPETAWKLTLKNVHFRERGRYWVGTLNIKY